jgi:P-type Ca2+ transporter type 2C
MVLPDHSHKGLSTNEAAVKLRQVGPNELESSKPRTLLTLAAETASEPMFLLLLACSVLYLMLGDLGEALLLSSAIFFVMLITFFQERRTERTLDALRDLSSPRARVIRDGIAVRIAAREVVPDDVALMAEGDRVPADGFVLVSKGLRVDESLLTGESVPVGKVDWNGKDPLGQAGGEDTPFTYAGTLVVQGEATVKIHATGPSTAMGRIGTSLHKTVRPPSSLQKETRRVVRIVAITSLLMSVGMAAVWWLRDGSVVRGILMGLTFAMSTIPEEFPVVLTIFMALGAWRISKKKVLTRQMHAIEALGSASFLCVDKTGTLTENKMTVGALWTDDFGLKIIADGLTTLAPPERVLIRDVALASDRAALDPMDIASIAVAKQFDAKPFDGLLFKKSFPLIRPILAVGHVWAESGDSLAKVFSKGAPETISRLCRLSPAVHHKVMTATEQMASSGFRVLAVASAVCGPGAFADGLGGYSYDFVGLVGFCDPVRAGVAEAVKKCHEAGIKVLMITGDFPATATSIARAIGLKNPDDVLTGDQLASMPDDILASKLKDVRVLARMVPEQKLHVVRILRIAGEVIAMTGDGVNDAPALKASHIGIAMGGRGTDVAREAAGLVLLNDDFTSIVDAIQLGRRINDNIQKAISYIIAIHIPIVGITILPLLAGGAPILLPLHLAFLELIIDPVCSVVFEAEPAEESIMKRAPRPIHSRLFSRAVVTAGMLEGVCACAVAIAVYYGIGRLGEAPDHARAVAFSTLVFANLGLILTLRSRSKPAWNLVSDSESSNPTLAVISISIVTLTGLLFYVPGVARMFHFMPPHGSDLLISGAAAAFSLVWFEIYKVFNQRNQRR